MKKWIALLLILALLVGMTACTGNKVEPTETTADPTTESTTESTTQPPEPTAHELFAEAAEALKTADNVYMTFDAKETHKVWQDEFLQTISGIAAYEGLQSDLVAKIDAKIFYNDDEKEVLLTELYADGKTYSTYNDGWFKDEAEQEDFLARQYPVCLFEAENFETGEVEEGENGKILKFSHATALETWLAPEYAVLAEATAQAVLGDKGIESMTYNVTYRQGAADVTVEITTDLKLGNPASLNTEPPISEDSYMVLSHCWAPMVMDRAMRNLLVSKNSSAQITQFVLNQAAGYALYNNEINFAHDGGKVLMKEEMNITTFDGRKEKNSEVENLYRNGLITVKSDGGSQSVKTDDEYIEDYVFGVFNDNLVYTRWITDCVAVSMGELFYFDFTSYNKLCLEYIQSQTNEALFGGGDPIGEIATGYEHKGFHCYMGVDPDTWLPTSYGFEYAGAYTIEGNEYEHSQKYYSQIMGANPMAYYNITDNLLPEEEPETPATPLFYHVTGEDGSEMWLLGTIHIGDERTAYLPQEIYDAFNASDALAVEFNMNTYEENMEEDEDYTEDIVSLYYYDDDSMTKDHLDEEVYEASIQMLKCLGQYHMNIDYLKPFVWESSITGALQDGGRRLFSEKGVDQRFLDMAEEAGKEILDVESAESQVGMLSGFSDGLQERLLMEALTYSRSEYNKEIMELFELWCSGDEEALRKYINDEEAEEEEEPEEMDEEEKALYEEYRNAMSTERDINMIEVAKGYLESGKTVFYAVGLAHLLTDDGLVDGLRAAGYTVELVQYQK